MTKLSIAFGLLRAKHWIKNVLVFFPIAFGGALLTDAPALASTLLGFCALSLVASGVYVVNDLRDAERDREHPVKCRRPIASGAVGPRTAVAVAAALFASGLAVSYAAAGPDLPSLLCLVAYVALNL